MAVHAVTCLEAHLHHFLVSMSFSTLGQANAAQPSDMLHLLRMHTAFCSACVDKVQMLKDLPLDAAVTSVLETSLTVTRDADERFLAAMTADGAAAELSRQAVCQRLVAQRSWLQGASEALVQRVKWLRTALAARAGQPALAHWHAMMGKGP